MGGTLLMPPAVQSTKDGVRLLTTALALEHLADLQTAWLFEGILKVVGSTGQRRVLFTVVSGAR